MKENWRNEKEGKDLKKNTQIILLVLFVFLLSLSVYASDRPYVEKRINNPAIYERIVKYSVPSEKFTRGASGQALYDVKTMPLHPGAEQSPGVIVGNTLYEYQHNSRVPRMIQRGIYGVDEDTLLVHFGWHHITDTVTSPGRSYAYNVWNSGKNGLLTNFVRLTTDQSGYVAMAVTPDNKAVVGGHLTTSTGGTSTHPYWDYGPGAAYFTNSNRVPPAIYLAGLVSPGPEGDCIWPSIDYHEVAGVGYTYAMSTESPNDENVNNQCLCFFRKIGIDELGSWTCEFVDTVFTISGVVEASQISGKIALGWIANRPDDGDPDTASCNTGVAEQDDNIYDQADNDVFYKINENCGIGGFHTPYNGTTDFWRPRINVTKYQKGEDGYRAGGDLTLLLDSSDSLHLAWPANVWGATTGDLGETGGVPYANRIFHYSEDHPSIRTVHSATWDQTMCNGGAWSSNAHIPMLSECEGKLYCIFVQYNDIPNGIADDCAWYGHEDGGADPTGSANGDLWVTISSNSGLTWDVARNITNSYTPLCGRNESDPEEWRDDGPCESDNWHSITKRGTDFAGNFPAHPVPTPQGGTRDFLVDPSGGTSTSDAYIDIQYILDSEAGGVVQDEGTWTYADVMWFRLRCVDPVETAVMVISMDSIGWPTWMHHDEIKDTMMAVENSGNKDMDYEITVYELTGADWLKYSGNRDILPAGDDNVDYLTVSMNKNSSGTATYNDPGTIVYLGGGLIFDNETESVVETLFVDVIVADTVVPPLWDTVYCDDGSKAQYLALTASNTGAFGNAGIGEVNMDFYNYGDCDNDEDSPVEGNSQVYLYEGSPVIGWQEDDDTLMFWSVYNNWFASQHSLYPISGCVKSSGDELEAYYSGTFVSGDSSIAMGLYTIAPKNVTENNTFLVQKLRVWSYDGEAHNGLTVGKLIDWDIPTDSSSMNDDGQAPFANLIYQKGVDLDYTPHTDDSMYCQDNANRYGGLAYVSREVNGVIDSTEPYGAFCEENDNYVYDAFYGSDGKILYEKMQQSGFRLSDSTEDLHTVMTYDHNLDLSDTDVVVYTTVLASIEDGSTSDLENVVAVAKTWITTRGRDLDDANDDGIPDGCNHPCIKPLRGNVDYDALDKINVVDLTYLVAYLFGGGYRPFSDEEGNVDGDPLEKINVVDLTYLVGYLFGGGDPPAECP